MVMRRRTLLKYLILIPALWILALFAFTIRTDSSSMVQSRNDIPINVVNQIVSAPSIVDRIKNVLPFMRWNGDHDHPSEERAKAHEQERQMNAIVQVIPPEVDKDHNERNASGPGEMGNAVRIRKDKLTEEEKRKYDEGWRDNAFNEYVSDMISVRRTLADVRDPE